MKVSKYRNLEIGSKYNKLTVLSFSHSKKFERKKRIGSCDYRYYYNFKCDCGKEKVISTHSVLNNTTKSCGCLQLEACNSLENKQRLHQNSIILNNNIDHNESAIKRIFSSYKTGANKRGYSFELTYDDFKELTNGTCTYCGDSAYGLSKSKNNKGMYPYNGIDRVDNSIGYIKSNCVTCCKYCNSMKRDTPLDEFKERITKIYKRLNG